MRMDHYRKGPTSQGAQLPLLVRHDLTNKVHCEYMVTVVRRIEGNIPDTATRTNTHHHRIIPVLVLRVQHRPTQRLRSHKSGTLELTFQVVMIYVVTSYTQGRIDDISLHESRWKYQMVSAICERTSQPNSVMTEILSLGTKMGRYKLHVDINVESDVSFTCHNLPRDARQPPDMEEIISHHLNLNVARRLETKWKHWKRLITVKEKRSNGGSGWVLKKSCCRDVLHANYIFINARILSITHWKQINHERVEENRDQIVTLFKQDKP